ncbi:hypothetical protein SLEP1_g50656 [Rubroshorea leprosula]|uniref:Uncharacterized protein n=1 Tax=Rubroshorea leprosula TaxID=152421 RepID=A0AAV5M0R0_9ROSI|nr:hypothetical protein SLEP1_g50656 [Rubroshorea leprosula]
MFECLKESSIVFLDIMFGIFINYIRIKRASPKIRNGNSMEESLIYVETNIEENNQSDHAAPNSFAKAGA